MTSRLRRLLSRAPLRPAEALGLMATGAALWGFAVVTPRPSWAPEWIGWLLSVIGAAAVARGAVGIAGAVGSLMRRLRAPGGWPGNRVPRGSQEIAEVLEKRPVAWEYLYFAGTLIAERESREAAFRDHELGYAAPSGERVEDDQAVKYLRDALDDVQGLLGSLTALMEPEVQERAFGALGEPGNPDRIRHLAERWTSVYGDLMSWAARLRAASKSSTYRTLFERLARLIDRPIQEYRDFVDEFVREVDRIPHALASHERVEINLELTLSIDDDALAALSVELARLEALLQGDFDQI